MSRCPECNQIHERFERKTTSYRMACPQGHEWTEEIPEVDNDD